MGFNEISRECWWWDRLQMSQFWWCYRFWRDFKLCSSKDQRQGVLLCYVTCYITSYYCCLYMLLLYYTILEDAMLDYRCKLLLVCKGHYEVYCTLLHHNCIFWLDYFLKHRPKGLKTFSNIPCITVSHIVIAVLNTVIIFAWLTDIMKSLIR